MYFYTLASPTEVCKKKGLTNKNHCQNFQIEIFTNICMNMSLNKSKKYELFCKQIYSYEKVYWCVFMCKTEERM